MEISPNALKKTHKQQTQHSFELELKKEQEKSVKLENEVLDLKAKNE